VSQNRSDRSNPLSTVSPLFETLRKCAESGSAGKEEKEDKGMPTFWRVFGGTLLSIGALVVMTAYQGMNASLAELRGEMDHLDKDLRKEMGRLSEIQADLVKKSDFDVITRATWTAVRELQEDRKALTALKERCAVLVDAHKAGEAAGRQLTEELSQLKRQQAAADERRVLVGELNKLRERLAQLEGRCARPTSVVPAGGEDEPR
jgi:hypothetical protein